MDHATLALIWFVLLGVLLAGYAILDGFDLGVGIVYPFVPGDDRERRILLNSIGPLWDGNEVWLVTFGGAFLAAFPAAYATTFSGFYLPIMFLLFALIFRGVSIEFRGKLPGARWRGFWDANFAIGSTLAALLFGVAVGNIMRGIALDERGDFQGTVLDLLNPYALLVGLLVVSLFAMHGTMFLYFKTEGALQERVRIWMWRTYWVFLAFFGLVTVATLLGVPRALANLQANPLLWLVPVVNGLAVASLPLAIRRRRAGQAFLTSCAVIGALVFLLGAALFPNLVASQPNPQHSLSVIDAASSERTLRIMLLIAVLGMPMVLSYTAVVYWTFRGKVRLDDHGY